MARPRRLRETVTLHAWLLDLMFLLWLATVAGAIGAGAYALHVNALLIDYQEQRATALQYEDLLMRYGQTQERLSLAYSNVVVRLIENLGLSGGALEQFVVEHQRAGRLPGKPQGMGGQ